MQIRLKVTTPLAESTIATAIVSPSARPRPSIDGGDDAGAGVGEDREPDHLPAGGAERERGLLVAAAASGRRSRGRSR